MGYYNVIVRGGCDYCDMATSLLKEKCIDYVVTDISNCAEAHQAYKEEYTWETVPIVIKHNDDKEILIGGFDDLEKHIHAVEA